MIGKASPGTGARASWRHLLPWLALLLAAAALPAMWFLRVREPPATQPLQPTLVVLPLHAAGTGVAQQPLLAEAMSRDLIARLAHANGLRVIAWTSAARAQAEKFDLDQLGARLHASYLLEGSLRQADDHLLLELRVAAIPGGRTLWAQAYTRKREEMRALEYDVAVAVADALSRKLDAAQAAAREAIDSPWLQAYLDARHLIDVRERARGIEALRALIAKAPGYAPAHATLARVLASALRYGAPEAGESDEVAREAGRALDLDPDLVDAHVALAILACRGVDWRGCMDNFSRAITLDPADTDSRVTHAYWLAALGHVDAALLEADVAWNTDPLSYDANFARARLLDTRGRHDEALAFLQAATPPSAGLVYARWHNAVWRQDFAAARDLAAAMPQSDGFREVYVGVTEALGDPSRWPQIQPMIGTSERANGRINILRIMMPGPDFQVELEGLERMLRDGWPSYYLLLWMPEYAAMRHDPAFADFLKRTRIIDYWRSNGFPPQCRAAGDGAHCD